MLKVKLICSTLLFWVLSPMQQQPVTNMETCTYGEVGVCQKSDPSRVAEDIGSSLGGHGAPIQAIALTPNDKTFLSLGKFDGTLCHWTLTAIVSDSGQLSDDSRNKLIDESRDQAADIQIEDTSLLRELNHSVSLAEAKSSSDIDQSVLVKGTHSKILNQSLASTVDTRGDMVEKSTITPSILKQPPASLQLEYVYGIQTGSKRNTIKFLHFTEERDQEIKQRASSIQAHLTGPLQQVAQKLYAPHSTQTNSSIGQYQIKHPNCSRFVGYFVSRVAVVMDPRKRTQRFYQGHAFKIGAMAVHPFRPIIATGQVQQKPTIHIWNYTTCGAEAIIQSYHKFGIITLAFSSCGKYLLSIGADQKYTLQLIDWQASNTGSETGRLLCFRPTGPRPIFWAQFDPFDSRKFVTIGYKHVAFWKAKGSHLSCSDYIMPKTDSDERPEIFTCSQFLKIPMGERWTSDLLLGSNKGHLSMIISGKLVRCQEEAHKGPINCLKYTDCLENNLLILFSAGEDGYLNLWDASLRPIQSIKISDLFISHLQAQRIKTAPSQEESLPSLRFPQESSGVQSFDIYQCQARKQQTSSGTQVVIGLRSGDALQLELIRNLEMANTSKKLEFNIKIASLTSGHSCYTKKTISLSETHPSDQIDLPAERLLYYPQLINSGKVFTTAHPVYPIFASAGQDRTVRLWNAKKGDAKLLWLEYIGREASAICFSPDGMLLAVGTTNGALLILLSKVEKFKFGTYQDMYELPNFRVVYSRKQSDAPVILIKFSKLGDLLAVSYDNDKVSRGYSQERVANSFILLYRRSNSPNLSEDTIALYQKVGRIQIPLSRLETTLLNQKKTKGALPLLAATHLDFSDDQRFMQICYQPLQAAGLRWSCVNSLSESPSHTISHDNKVFLYWDIEASTIVSDPARVKSVEFSSWSLAPAILARYEGMFKDFKMKHQIVSDAAAEAMLKGQESTGVKINIESSLEECICRMSSSSRLQSIEAMCTGDLRGKLHLLRFNALVGRAKYEGGMNPNILLAERDMGMTRSFSAHSSPVLSITRLPDERFLLTSAAGDDGCIMQWAIHYEDMNWELDYYTYDNEGEDPFGEIPQINKFNNLLNEIWLPRMQLSDTLADMEHQVQESPPYRLELQSVLGRRAYDRRGNMAIDALQRIVYIAGSLIIFLWEGERRSESQESKRKGAFKLKSQMQPSTKGAHYELRSKYLRPFEFDSQHAVPSPELSCFTMSHDKRIIAVGTAERCARIAAWEILTNLYLGCLELKNLAVVMKIKINRQNQHLVVSGVTREHQQALVVVDLLLARKVLAFKTLAHSLPFKIKDIEWVPGSRTEFVTCGIQHLSYWRLTGQLLEYRGGDLVFYKDGGSGYVGAGLYAQNRQIDSSIKRALEGNQVQCWGANLLALQPPPSQPHNLRVSLLCMSFIQSQVRQGANELLMVAGADDAHLYLFKEERIHSRYKHHYGQVTCMDVSTEFILTGGRDGRAVLWKLLIEGNIPHLRRIKAFSLIENKEMADEPQKAVAFPQFNIQSVSLGVNRALLGTRTGNIIEFEIAKEGPAGAKAHNIHLIEPDQLTNGVSWMQCVDNEMPLSIATDEQGNNLFYLGKRGVFAVWDFKSWALLYGRAFHQSAISVIFWQTRDFVVLVFEKEIVVLDCYTGPQGEDPPTFQVVKNYHLQIPKITDAKLSPNEQLLAVASISGEPVVSIYDTKGGIGQINPREYGGGANVGSFSMLTTLKGFKSSVRYLDFSTDNFFLICEENLGEILLFELETQKVVNTATIEFDVEWQGDGLRSSPSTKGVYAFFKHTNAITKMVKPLNKPVVVVGDSVGTIKLFRYPNRHNQSFYQCYTDHIFSVQSLVFSLDGNTMLSSSQADRSVFRWQVIHEEEEKIEDSNPRVQVKLIGTEKIEEAGLFGTANELQSHSMRSSKYRHSPN